MLRAARLALLAAPSLLLLAVAPTASAQSDALSPDSLHGVIDLRLAAADGEPSFTADGFGKLRYGGGAGGDVDPKAQVGLAAIEWAPTFGWMWSAVIDAGYQPGQEHPVDLYQAYLVFKPVPRSSTRFRARVGYFYPPVSLENDGRVWGLTDTITPSAINSWIGEEVKVVGAEGQVSTRIGDQEIALTAAVFEFDDTAGTLLSFRGWAMHDLQSQAFGSFDLPPLSPSLEYVQDSEAYSTRDIDHRPGFYAELEWSPPAPVRLEALVYDNRGNGTTVTPDLQWAWATRFVDVGATAQLDQRTRFLAQALTGQTQIGWPDGSPITHLDFAAGYLLAARDIGRDTLTGRVDLFETSDLAPAPPAPLSEHGWALTAAWRRPLTEHLDLRLEAVHIESDRPSRILANERPFQSQTQLQSSLRLSY